ncbi:MAG: hypothetical protein NTY90_01395 [Candidatus Micrarchaeota archaeon]|nr:hypothetical protein [Candidatus Micrarchaeota archaeon]
MSAGKGKLVVFEGLDSAGKRTQALMLLERLKKSGRKTAYAAFPTYEKTVFGKLVGKYLRGELKLGPYSAALVYALDRMQFRGDFVEKLRHGAVVVLDRYVNSNLYQAARVAPAERPRFIKWLDAIESPLPAAGAVVFLNVPPEVSERLLEARGAKMKRFKGKDLHEKSLEYQREVGKVYAGEARRRKWIIVDCWRKAGGDVVMRPREEIHEAVWSALKARRIVR